MARISTLRFPSVEKPSKPLTNPQISLYSSYYGTLIPNAESGEGVVSSGTADTVLDYYPYGAERISTGSTAAKTYIGEYNEPDLGLQYLHARYMAPQRGQFLSQDPVHLSIGSRQQIQQLTGMQQRALLTDPQALNSYSYAKGNPMMYKDPQGNVAIPLLYYGVVTAPTWAPSIAGAALGIVSGVYLADQIDPATFQTSTLQDSRPFDHVLYPRMQDPNDLKPPREGLSLLEKAAYFGLGTGVLGYTVHEAYEEYEEDIKKYFFDEEDAKPPSHAPKGQSSDGVNVSSSLRGGGGGVSYGTASASISAASQAISRGDYTAASKHIKNASSVLGSK